MRKLIAILLIVAIACAEVDTTPKAEKSEFKELLDILDFDVDSVELFFTEIFDGIGNFLGSIWDTIKGGIQWMKNSGLWDSVKSILLTTGKYAATHFCTKYISSDVCKTAIDGISKAF